ncbi:MAG: HAD family hydrolase [Desulfovibrionaceae bacterium]|jgi:phosphoglycolate phosphatase|nr:HAD family hydrolase [Desulfovibrionaceae bacterium]
MPTPRLAALIFDFDGTLAELTIDFADMRARARAIAADFFAAPPEPDGLPVLEWTAALAERLRSGGDDRSGGNARSGGDDRSGDGESAAKELTLRIGDMIVDMEVEAAGRGRLFPATRPMLAELARRGVAAAIVTRNCRAAVRTVFPDADRVCGCVLAREDVPRVKPHPDHVLAALARVGADPGRALMVGDHPMDVAAGRNAGTRTAAVASGRLSQDELRAAKPDFVARDCAELMERLLAAGWLG